MKKLIFTAVGLLFLLTAATVETESILKQNFITGNPEIASINKLSFGPEGILFIGDSKNATIYALDTKDIRYQEKASEINLNGFDKKVAASLGTTVENVKITDMAVNPISKNLYFSVHMLDGTPVLLRLVGSQLENVSIKNTSYSKTELVNAVAKDKKDGRGRPLRVWAISDLKYHNGRIMVSGLSNKEFSSTFRSIEFPFNETEDFASLEIYHAAHGRYETYAPIKTFDVVSIENKDYLLASYTCTPLVLFPMDELNNGKHLKGRTVAELGSGNSPLDMISIQRDGQTYFLMSNTSRSMMRIDYNDIAGSKESITTPVEEFAVAEGVPYVSVPLVNILQLDQLDEHQIVYLQRTASGDLVLKSRSTKWV